MLYLFFTCSINKSTITSPYVCVHVSLCRTLYQGGHIATMSINKYHNRKCCTAHVQTPPTLQQCSWRRICSSQIANVSGIVTKMEENRVTASNKTNRTASFIIQLLKKHDRKMRVSPQDKWILKSKPTRWYRITSEAARVVLRATLLISTWGSHMIQARHKRLIKYTLSN